MDDDYLKKDFDITKLTIPKIKKILIENGITEFPTRVKKDQLIEIFNKNIDLIRKKKKEESRSKNIYQEERSSIIELEVNKRDGEGGEYTSGRYGDKGDKGKDVKGVKDSKGVKGKDGIKDKKFISTNKQTPTKPILNRPPSPITKNQPSPITKNQPSPIKKNQPPSPHNSSFLESLSAHLRSTSRRRKSLEDVHKDINNKDKKINKVIVDVDSGVSDTSFFNSQNDINKDKDYIKDKKLIIPSTPTSTTTSPPPAPSFFKYYFLLLIPLFLIPFYFLLPYCTNGDLICLPVPKNGKIINGKLICDNGFILKKSFLREKCIRDSKELRMLKKINFIINELEILKGDYKYGLVKDYKKKINEVIGKGEGGYDSRGGYNKDKDTKQPYNQPLTKQPHTPLDTTTLELLEILKHSSKVKIDNDLIYAVNHKFTLKSFIRHYSLKAFYLLLLILSLTLIFYIFYKRRQGILEKKYSSQKIVKEILNILLRQLICSSKNTRFPGFVYVDHLKDVFLVDKKLWEMVKEKVEKNSNVKKGKIENKETWEWVGPYIENRVNG